MLTLCLYTGLPLFIIVRCFSALSYDVYANLCVMSFFIMVIVAGKKGGHKGRVRTYTSPEEIDAQMKAEKERKKVCGGLDIQRLLNHVPHRVKRV